MTQLIDNLSFPLVTPDRPWPGLAAFDESSANTSSGATLTATICGDCSSGKH